MLSGFERNSLLRQCWRQGHWADGLGTIVRPMRSSLHRMRRKMLHRGSPSVTVAEQVLTAPAFSESIRPAFCEKVPDATAVPFPKRLADDVNQMAQGSYPLAGGAFRSVDFSALDQLADLEDWHAYHRMYWAVRLSQAICARVPGAEKLFLAEVPRWLDNAWVDDSVVGHSYTTSERIASFSEILFWIAASKSTELLAVAGPMKNRIWQDACRLQDRMEFALGVHNHLLNNARGLLIAALALPECEEAREWSDRAFQVWEELGPKLILEDGTFGEQSSHYHLLLCRTALEYWLAAGRLGRELAPGLRERIRAMFRLANDLLRGDGSLPRFGDVCPDHGVEELRGLTAAGYFLGILNESPAERCIMPLTFYYCDQVGHLPPSNQLAPARHYPAGGFAFLRSESTPVDLVVHADPRPEVGTHGDAGRGSFELRWRNQFLVREPGSFLGPTRQGEVQRRSGRIQNVTCLDGLAPGVTPEDRRFLPEWYLPNGGTLELINNSAIHLRCEGFRRLRPDILLFRTWQLDDSGSVSFSERIEGSGEAGFESRMCLGDLPWSEPVRDGATDVSRMQWRDADGASIQMTVHPPQGTKVSVDPCTFVAEYGQQKPGRTLRVAGDQRLPLEWHVKWEFNLECLQ